MLIWSPPSLDWPSPKPMQRSPRQRFSSYPKSPSLKSLAKIWRRFFGTRPYLPRWRGNEQNSSFQPMKSLLSLPYRSWLPSLASLFDIPLLLWANLALLAILRGTVDPARWRSSGRKELTAIGEQRRCLSKGTFLPLPRWVDLRRGSCCPELKPLFKMRRSHIWYFPTFSFVIWYVSTLSGRLTFNFFSWFTVSLLLCKTNASQRKPNHMLLHAFTADWQLCTSLD